VVRTLVTQSAWLRYASFRVLLPLVTPNNCPRRACSSGTFEAGAPYLRAHVERHIRGRDAARTVAVATPCGPRPFPRDARLLHLDGRGGPAVALFDFCARLCGAVFALEVTARHRDVLRRSANCKGVGRPANFLRYR